MNTNTNTIAEVKNTPFEMQASDNTLLADNENRRYMSFVANTVEEKMAVYNAINSPDHKVSDMINKVIKMKDCVLVEVNLADEETGEARDGVRSIIIDVNGETYAATSNGIYNSLRNIKAIFGTLHFEEGIDLMVVQISTKKGSTLSIKLGK